jgi:arginyl-tRNA synthetase
MINEIKECIFDVVNKYIEIENIKIKIEKIQNIKFGDYSSNILMILKPETDVIDKILTDLKKQKFIQDNIQEIEYKEPGFLNFFLKKEFLVKNLEKITNFDEKMF